MDFCSGVGYESVVLPDISDKLDQHMISSAQQAQENETVFLCYGTEYELTPTAQPYKKGDSEDLTTTVNMLQFFSVLWDGPPVTEVIFQAASLIFIIFYIHIFSIMYN